MNPFWSKAYFLPGGGSGIWTPAVLANSSKDWGRRRFFIFHPNIARLSNWSWVGPVLVETDGAVGCIRAIGGVAVGMVAAVAAGVAAEEVESDCDVDATGGGVL